MSKLIQNNVDLKPYNSFGLSCTSKKFAEFDSVENLINLLRINEEENNELLVLGGGSNILLTQDFDGLVLKNNLLGIDIVAEDDLYVYVKAAAGEIWHNFVLYAIEHNLGGIENLSLIPGSVGAAPMQNIGAYGVEIKDVFQSLEALNIHTKKIQTFETNDCQFGYRESIFKRSLKGQFIITSITLKLSKKHTLNTSYGAIEGELAERQISNPTIKDISDAVIAIRQSKLPDPAKIGNSGSFFKNPVVSLQKFLSLKERFPTIANYPVDQHHVKIAAGWLIDQAGWKGKTFGNYGVHKNQALVLVNYGGADGKSIYELSSKIVEDIQERYGIELEREVNII